MQVTRHITSFFAIALLQLSLAACSPPPKCTDDLKNICVEEGQDESALDHYRGVQLARGDIRIENSEIHELSALSKLSVIEGDLIIKGNEGLKNLAGLENLTEVQGEISIESNPNLSTLSHLQKLNSAHSLSLWRNDALLSLEGLEKIPELDSLWLGSLPKVNTLEYVEHIRMRNLTISNMDNIYEVRGFNGVQEQGNVSIDYNDNLTSINLFDTRVTPIPLNSVRIYHNSSLEQLRVINVSSLNTLNVSNNESLHELFTTDSFNNSQVTNLEIRWLPLIQDLSVVENFSFNATETISINYNESLLSLDGLENVTDLVRLVLQGNSNLDPNVGLPNLETLESLLVARWHKLENLQLFSGIQIQSLSLIENDNLVSIDGPDMSSLRSLRLIGNVSLSDISATNHNENLRFATFERNSSMTSLVGFPMVTDMVRLIITDMPELTSLNGLESLAYVEQLYIEDNPNLLTLSNLTDLIGVSDFRIRGNDVLSSLGMTNLEGVGRFIIESNPELCSSELEEYKSLTIGTQRTFEDNKDC